ncbi:MAG TPA: hypothetical protein VGM64_13280 [Lacunisphaera sp.]|jgi:hypothetical protein
MVHQRVDFISYAQEPPILIGSFFWSDALGLRCSNRNMMEDMERNGVATPPDGIKLFPGDGRAFFEALQWRGSSYVKVTQARAVTTVVKI